MKKASLFLIALIIIIFSCEDDTPITSTSELDGTRWADLVLGAEVQWTPTEDGLVIAAPDGLFYLALESGQPSLIDNVGLINEFVQSTDNSTIYYIAIPEVFKIYRISRNGSNKEIVVGDVLGGLVLAPDNSRLAYLGLPLDLFIYDLASNTESLVIENASPLSFSPDASQLLVSKSLDPQNINIRSLLLINLSNLSADTLPGNAPDEPGNIFFNSQGIFDVTYSSLQEIRIMDLLNATVTTTVMTTFEGSNETVLLSPKLDKLVVTFRQCIEGNGGAGGTCQNWDYFIYSVEVALGKETLIARTRNGDQPSRDELGNPMISPGGKWLSYVFFSSGDQAYYRVAW